MKTVLAQLILLTQKIDTPLSTRSGRPIGARRRSGSGCSALGSPPDQKTCALALRLPVLEAHTQTHRDLFITSHPDFLTLRSRILDANIKDLREGLRIVGLYLRWSGDFTICASQKTKRCFYRHLFYWVLCRHRLPAMWRYFSACLQYGQETHTQNEELGDLAGTILERCVRVLQARDEVGFRFYQRQDYTTRDECFTTSTT